MQGRPILCIIFSFLHLSRPTRSLLCHLSRPSFLLSMQIRDVSQLWSLSHPCRNCNLKIAEPQVQFREQERHMLVRCYRQESPSHSMWCKFLPVKADYSPSLSHRIVHHRFGRWNLLWDTLFRLDQQNTIRSCLQNFRCLSLQSQLILSS